MIIKNKILLHGILIEILCLCFYIVSRIQFKEFALFSFEYHLIALLIFLLLGGMLILYVLSIRNFNETISIKTIIIFTLLFNVTLFIIWPTGSEDVIGYISLSRIVSEHNLNPYIVPYSTLNHDNLYYIVNNYWASQTCLYGPPFVLIGSAITFIAGNNFVLNVFLFKLFFLIINLLNCFLIYKITKKKVALILYAWNPLILYEFANNGHNDSLVIFFLLLSIFYFLKNPNKIKYFSIALFFILMSVLIKFITLVLVPIFFLVSFLKSKRIISKTYLTLASFFIISFTLIIFYLPFWDKKIFNRVFGQANFVPPNFLGASPFIRFNSYIAKLTDYSLLSSEQIILLGKIIFILFYLLIIYLILKNNNLKYQDVYKYFSLSLFFLFLLVFTWLMPWYFTILITMLIINYAQEHDKFSKRLYYIMLIAFTFYGISYYLYLK